MMKKNRTMVLFFSVFISFAVFAQTKEIALTIDDLPFVGSADHNEAKLKRKHDRFMQILDTLKSHQIPATGFIIAGSIEKGQWELLEAFRSAGFGLGNHTYTHKSLGNMSADKYIEDVAKADKVLSPVMTEPKYFRYPYLAEGAGEKKAQVHNFLTSLHYRIAPVTIDSKDYRFNEQLYHIPYRSRPAQLPGLIKRYLAYIWSQTQRAEKGSEGKPIKQVLLIHANLLNSHALGELIEMYQKNGYRFVPLTDIVPEAPQPVETIHSMMTSRNLYCRL